MYTCNFNSGSGLRVSHLSYYYYEKMANLINFTDDFGRKIYIARDDSRGKRPLINRSELNALMTKRGFNVVFLEELSFYEKIALFKSADIIIGDFSSGWGHIVFCKKFTKLILLEHDIYKFQGFYKEIANSKCLDLKVVETKNIFRLMYLKFLKLIWTLLKDVDKRANSLSWKVNI
ncbi:TPA: glycosyltransferase 61 family protein, partial [Escherichia coli]